jgi:hypothetical protein
MYLFTTRTPETKSSRVSQSDLNNYVTSWSRLFLDKLTGLQPVKKFPLFYGTHRFIAAFKQPANSPYPGTDQSSP